MKKAKTLVEALDLSQHAARMQEAADVKAFIQSDKFQKMKPAEKKRVIDALLARNQEVLEDVRAREQILTDTAAVLAGTAKATKHSS